MYYTYARYEISGVYPRRRKRREFLRVRSIVYILYVYIQLQGLYNKRTRRTQHTLTPRGPYICWARLCLRVCVGNVYTWEKIPFVYAFKPLPQREIACTGRFSFARFANARARMYMRVCVCVCVWCVYTQIILRLYTLIYVQYMYIYTDTLYT